jgi:hypothetical protein
MIQLEVRHLPALSYSSSFSASSSSSSTLEAVLLALELLGLAATIPDSALNMEFLFKAIVQWSQALNVIANEARLQKSSCFAYLTAKLLRMDQVQVPRLDSQEQQLQESAKEPLMTPTQWRKAQNPFRTWLEEARVYNRDQANLPPRLDQIATTCLA